MQLKFSLLVRIPGSPLVPFGVSVLQLFADCRSDISQPFLGTTRARNHLVQNTQLQLSVAGLLLSVI